MEKPGAAPPIALQAFETLAEPFAARADTKPHNAYYERPATLSLVPDVSGRRVLDAGCGPGFYTAWLLDRGAEVVAVDVSPKMVGLARARVGQRAQVIQADLGHPLDFLASASFDLVLSALTLDYVRDWDGVFREFFRVLRRPGQLVFSAGHPFADFLLHPAGNYFQTEFIENDWTGFGMRVTVPTYRRPLQAAIGPLLAAGFTLERLLEPTPTPEFQRSDPRHYEELSRQPGFLCIRAIKA
ncbi:MAG TPA: class I SAM-dependent methyltransferase [Clostridiales bacterium UBA8153]|nr:class I SAM-dependent methyltransferase [Clostridiales bacterium UBA8153]